MGGAVNQENICWQTTPPKIEASIKAAFQHAIRSFPKFLDFILCLSRVTVCNKQPISFPLIHWDVVHSIFKLQILVLQRKLFMIFI